VTSIGEGAFAFCSSLTEITVNAGNEYYVSDNGVLYNKDKTTIICYPAGKTATSFVVPASVTSIGDAVFSDCVALSSVTIPDSVTSIGQSAFFGCTSLSSVIIPNSVTSIEDHVFCSCTSLTSVTIPDSVTSIGSSAFSGCYSLTSVTIPDSVTHIGGNVFCDCTSLTAIVVDADNEYYTSDNGVLYNKDKTILICYPAGKTDLSFLIPDSVTSIGSSAFRRCTSLTSVTIPDSVTSIGYNAFYVWYHPGEIVFLNPDCTIYDNSDTFNEYMTVIRGYDNSTAQAYAEKYNRTFVSLNGNDDDVIFSGSAGENVDFTITRDGHMAITGTGAMYDYWSTSRPWFQYASFIKSVSVADGITSIGNYAFEGCANLTSVTIPDSVMYIRDYAFEGCVNLPSVIIPDSVTWIGSQAFRDCISLTSVTIPDSVTSIGGWAFYGCTSLTSVAISDSLTSIGSSPFYDSAYYNDANNWEDDVLYIGKYLIDAKTDIAGAYTVKDGTKIIADDAFYGCESLTAVTIPDGVTQIGDTAFRFCTSLISVTIPNSVTSINEYAFGYCTSLTEITILNPSCRIYSYDNNRIFSTATIYGYENSTAQSYAQQFNCTFVALECDHADAIFVPGTAATCTKDGKTDGTVCNICKVTTGSEVIPAPGHTPGAAATCTEDQICTVCGETLTAKFGHAYVCTDTTNPTCTEDGVKTYVCSNNANHSYTETVSATGHDYNTVVIAPTCTAQGYTTYTCECGDSYVADYKNATGHSHKATVTIPATHLATGVMTYTCACGDTYTETIDKLTAHEHKAEVTTPATHLTTGVRTYTCACGDTYTTVIPKTTKHTYSAEVLEEAQCKKDGKMLYVCECGHSYTETIPETGHADEDDNSKCDHCGIKVCDHICHQTGILGIFWKIIRFFWKLFGMNPVCECGRAHY